MVTNTNNSGPGSLLQTLINANTFAGDNTITFEEGLGGQTITLSDDIPPLSETVTVQGPAGGITVDRAGLLTLSTTNPAATVSFDANVTFGNSSNDSIVVSGPGNFVFDGPVNLNSGSQTALQVSNSGLSTFNGNITISTTTGRGLLASGGTIAIQGSNNTITTQDGIAVSIGSAIAPEGVTFTNITASRSASAFDQSSGAVIALNDTGLLGSFNVTGGTLTNTSTGSLVEMRGELRTGFTGVTFNNLNSAFAAFFVEEDGLDDNQEIQVTADANTFNGNAFFADVDNGQVTADFSNNSITSVSSQGVEVTSSRASLLAGVGSVDLTVRGNVFSYATLGNVNAVDISAENDSRFCLDIENNSIADPAQAATADYALNQVNTSTLELEGLVSDLEDPAAIESFVLTTRNNAVTAAVTPTGFFSAEAVVPATGSCASPQ